MADLSNAGVQRLFQEPNHAVLSTFDAQGEIHSTVVWIDLLDGLPAVNGDAARVWCRNLARDPRASVVVYDQANPDIHVVIQGSATARTVGAVAHDDRLAEKFRGPGITNCARDAQRISWLITPERVRYHAG